MKIINNGKMILKDPERTYTLGNVEIVKNHIVDVKDFFVGFYAEYDKTQEPIEIYVYKVEKRESDDLLPQLRTILWDKSTNWEHAVEVEHD